MREDMAILGKMNLANLRERLLRTDNSSCAPGTIQARQGPAAR
jgi:hypothetical protein